MATGHWLLANWIASSQKPGASSDFRFLGGLAAGKRLRHPGEGLRGCDACVVWRENQGPVALETVSGGDEISKTILRQLESTSWRICNSWKIKS
jgi:hypothetical protein